MPTGDFIMSRVFTFLAISFWMLVGATSPTWAGTRSYTRGDTNPLYPPALAAQIDTALSRTGTVVTVHVFSVTVTHPNLGAGDDATINSLIAAYVYDPLFVTSADTAAERAEAIVRLSGTDADGKLKRAIAAVILDEINVLRASYPIPVVSITRSGTTATVTTRWAHGLANGLTVTIHGVDVAAYNGAVVIAGASGTTFTYTVAGSPATPATGSILTFPVIAAPAARTWSQLTTAIQTRLNSGSVD